MAFFLHTGRIHPGIATMPTATHDTLLDSIVADVQASGAAVGWTIYDDRRQSTPQTGSEFCIFIPQKFRHGTNLWSWTFTTASLTATHTSYYCDGPRAFAPGTSTLSRNLSSSHYTITAVPHGTATYITPAHGEGTSSTVKNVYTCSYGYVVLKCSGDPDYYLKISRTAAPGMPLFMQAFVSWDSGTHSGTDGGPAEYMRCLTAGSGMSGSLTSSQRYALGLYQDTFFLWLEVDPASREGGDVYYVGTLSRSYANDTYPVVQICSNSVWSGMNAGSKAWNSTPTGWHGYQTAPVPVMKNLEETWTWCDPTIVDVIPLRETTGQLWPRGRPFVWDIVTPTRDLASRFLACRFDYYGAGQSNTSRSQPTALFEAFRGTVKNILCPVSNPTGMHMAVIGPFEDGKRYIVLRMEWPDNNNTSGLTVGMASSPCSSFSFPIRYQTTNPLGDIWADESSAPTLNFILAQID